MSLTARVKPDALAAKIQLLIERGQFDAAARLIPAVAAMAPGEALSSVLSVRLAFAQGNQAKAVQDLNAALATWPENGDLLRLYAQLAMACQDFPGAVQASAAAVIANREDAEAKSLLGRALLALGSLDQARLCLQEAVLANPQDVPAVLALAEAAPEQACLLLSAASARMPHHTLLRTTLIRTLIDAVEPEAAWHVAEAARDSHALDVDGYLLAGHAAAALDHWPQARQCWKEVLRLAPRHPSALYRLAAEQARGPDRLDPAVIAIADNARADTFELVAMAGGTILPGRVRAALMAASVKGPALDLGCGTGLCAIASHDLGLAWDGVEAASRFASIVRDRGLYRALHEADPASFLNQVHGRWQAIAFNVTAGLVRHLDGLFAGLAAHLTPGGIAIGAIVAAPDAGRFGPFGCFEHTEADIRSAANFAGLIVQIGSIESLMTVDGVSLHGRIVELRAQ